MRQIRGQPSEDGIWGYRSTPRPSPTFGFDGSISSSLRKLLWSEIIPKSLMCLGTVGALHLRTPLLPGAALKEPPLEVEYSKAGPVQIS